MTSELERELIDEIRGAVEYWRREEQVDKNEALSGLAHSILCILDGVSGGEYGYLLVPEPWADNGEAIPSIGNSMLHELLYEGDWR
jgi:hypothetical protein